MKCPRCGEAVDASDAFCGNCDFALQPSQPLVQQATFQSAFQPSANQPAGLPAPAMLPQGQRAPLTRNVKIILGLTAIPMALMAAGFIFLISTSQISEADANKICQSFYQDVRSQITAVPGYVIMSGGKSCAPQKDELNATDYGLTVYFRLSKSDNISAALTTANMQRLAKALPQKNYPIDVTNVAGRAGQQEDICVQAGRYINNDGKDYPQGPPDHRATYIVPGSTSGFVSACADI